MNTHTYTHTQFILKPYIASKKFNQSKCLMFPKILKMCGLGCGEEHGGGFTMGNLSRLYYHKMKYRSDRFKDLRLKFKNLPFRIAKTALKKDA